MYIIAGLGNPGKEYINTRHNVGFGVIDILADKYNISVLELRSKALVGKGMMEGRRVILVKPLTYMNLSGESIRPIVDYYKADAEQELIVISDDVSLPPGGLRIRKRGSAGGHNGLKNIIRQMGTENFTRIRLGVGEKPRNYDLADWVLGHFNGEERKAVDEAADRAVHAVELILSEGADAAMNIFNRKIHAEE